MNKETTIITVIGLAFLVIFGGAVWWYAGANPDSGKPVTIDTSAMVSADSHMTGTFGSKVTMVEWGDFQCPACGAEYPVINQILEHYKANPNFNFVFRNFPLPMHQNAIIGAEATEAAAAQGKYWEMNNALYTHQNEWGESGNPTSFFHTYAQNLGLDVAVFDAALTNHTYKAKVQADYDQARSLNLDHTPTLFINGVEQKDTSYAGIRKALDAALAQ